MTRKTDLTAEQLDELHASVFRETQRVPHKATYGITLGDCLALIAMARDKQAAEEAIAFLQGEHEDAVRWQVRAEAAERERDALRTAMGIIWQLSRLPFSDSARHTLMNIALACAEGEPNRSQVAQWVTALAQPTDAGGA